MDASVEDRAVVVLEHQVHSLRQQVRRNEELLDVLASPPWKRLWWVVCGWRPYRLGRWYGQGR